MVERRVTLRDVAVAAGVNQATVSRALRGDPRISPSTRERVVQAAQRLGYVPNAAARSLVLRATHTLGLMIPNVTDPIHGQFVAGFEQEAAARGYSVMLTNGFRDPERERQALWLLATHRADGVALVGSILDPRQVLASAGPTRVVFVAGEHLSLANKAPALAVGEIRADEAAGVHAIVRHLAKQGYRRVAYLGGAEVASNVARRAAARRALAEAGLPRPRLYEGGEAGWRCPGPLAATIAVERPEAVICYDDKLAIALLDALRAHGVRVPADVALTGFDDIPFAALCNPRLTTVVQPAAEMGRLAVAMLLEARERGQMPASRLLPVQLVVRESSVRALDGSAARA